MNLLPKQLRDEERVPVLDPKVGILSLVALSQLDRSFIPLQIHRFAEALEKILMCIVTQYTVLDIPRFRRDFDIHCSTEPDANKAYAVAASLKQAKKGMKCISRLDFYQLGFWRAGPMRMVGAKYRKLYVGPIPASALTEQ